MSSSGHFSPRKDLVPIVQEAAWAPGPVWTDAKILPPPLFFLTSSHPTCSEALYQLCCFGPLLLMHLPEFTVTLGFNGSVIQYLLCTISPIFSCVVARIVWHKNFTCSSFIHVAFWCDHRVKTMLHEL